MTDQSQPDRPDGDGLLSKLFTYRWSESGMRGPVALGEGEYISKRELLEAIRATSPSSNGAEGAGETPIGEDTPYWRTLRTALVLPVEEQYAIAKDLAANCGYELTGDAYTAWLPKYASAWARDLAQEVMRDMEDERHDGGLYALARWFDAISSSAPDAMRLPDFEEPRVQIVYEMLCDDALNTPPNPEEHWEGWIARNIVAALSAPVPSPDGIEAMLADERVEWRSDLHKRAAERDLERRTIDLSPSGAGTAEPVAWRHKTAMTVYNVSDKINIADPAWGFDLTQYEPLYAATPVRGDRETIIRLAEIHLGAWLKSSDPALQLIPTAARQDIRDFADAILSLNSETSR